MARTNPHHDWPETETGAPKSNGAEWESLRNELVALLDQVEDHVASAQPAAEAAQLAQPASAAPAPSLPPRQADPRHAEALRSVRKAVYRLADRGGDERPVMRESVVDAINQIRARQTGAVHQAEPAAPVPTPAPEPQAAPPEPNLEISDLARSLDAMGERIGKFEDHLAAKLETGASPSDISAQIGQLSDVIELLATAVGETGQIRRLEAQIGNLAELLASDRATSKDATAQRIEDLTATIEKLVNHQVETGGRLVEQVVQTEERQARSMETIETNVRSIYDRIDALEVANGQPSPQIEQLSHDMAALTEAVSANREPQSLLAKIDALSARIETIEAPSRDEAETLAQSVAALREVIADTIAPRFAAIEDKIGAIETAPAASPSFEAIETQLRQIAKRVEDTSAQLKSMADVPAAPVEGPDFDRLADRIVERTLSSAPVAGPANEGIEKADLEALEDRLAQIFARSSSNDGEAAGHLAGVQQSIAQVDNRIARLEAMLNTPKTEAAPAPSAETAQDGVPPAQTRRRKPEDTMPVDPTTGNARRVLSQAPIIVPDLKVETTPAHEDSPDDTLEDAALEPETGFAVDPETIERPAKPQSSFALEREHPFDMAPRDSIADSVANVAPTSTRANFIEAARRSARQQLPEDDGESRSLIARALARFQRGEAEQDEVDQVDHAAPEPDGVEEPVSVPEREDDVADAQQSFIARNRRALLLGTALVVVVALAAPLLVDRLTPNTSAAPQAQSVQPAQEPEASAAPTAQPDVQPEPAAAAPDTAAEETADTPGAEASASDTLMSGVRVIEQQPSLSAARVDASTLSGNPLVDPVQTASISPDAQSYAPTARGLETAPITSASLPEAVAPEGIEPAALGAAAESGDMHAQFEIGAILTEGTVVEQDLAQAGAWYERSAAQGFAPAQYRLGSLFESGQGVERDLDMARLWYQRAAEAGNRMSMHNLASLYAGGELETQDFAAAAHWFEEAASRGLTDSQFNLGMLYARGLGVDQDFEQSYLWFSLAARSGDEDAGTARDDVARSLEAETVQRLNDTIDDWTPTQIEMAANFAPIGTWSDTFDPGPEVANTDVVLRVQMLLGKLGYDVGTPDGIAGPKTRDAIAQFESETGMSESGSVNPRLLAVLGSQPV